MLPLPFGSPSGSLTVYIFLQFERVFVINLPERYDKLDAFSLAASVTGFTYDVIEGIKGSTVVNKTLPALEGLPQVTLSLALLWSSSQTLTLNLEREIAEQHRWLLARALEFRTEVSAPANTSQLC